MTRVYSGNPKCQTAYPTTEQLLAAFCDLTLYLYSDGSREISRTYALRTKKPL
ncbi:MAG: hypothetical protein QNJ34_11130 [Xenococcaceae cyanobacterium MO_188.B29]|nr:hypothetical protein [Xenococcaceae cyanobacterium MO_188.B29]